MVASNEEHKPGLVIVENNAIMLIWAIGAI
jgi:hypothetical protein